MNIVLLRSIKLSTLLGGLLCSHFSVAANDLGKINLVLNVEVVAFSCGISVNQSNKTVELGSWSTQVLKKKGDTSPEKIIEYQISDCPAIPAVTFRFTGPKDSQEPELLAIDQNALSAKNVAIELLNHDKKRLALNSTSAKVQLDKNGNGLATFYARYMATSALPHVGKANATATFSIQYD